MTEYLNHLYSRKARRDGRPMEIASVYYYGLRHFSFVPGTVGWQDYPFTYLAEQPVAPSMTFSDPSGKPLALWLFSRSERAMAVILAEEMTIDDLANPGLRIIETVHQSGAIAVAGDFQSEQVTFVHAYLLPLGKLQLDDRGMWWGDIFALQQVVGAVPLLFGVGAVSATGQMRLNTEQSLNRLLAMERLILFFKVAWVARWAVFPAALLWLTRILFRLRSARREWDDSLSRVIPGNPANSHFGLFRFLTANLAVEAEKLLAETTEQRRKEASQHHEQSRREHLVAEIRHYSKTLAQPEPGIPCDETWLAEASMVELEETAARLRLLAERQQEQIEKEQQAARERARQIHWLESEFAAIPSDKRLEVTGAWALYEQACATSDPGKRLEMLKSARKLLPKEFREDQP